MHIILAFLGTVVTILVLLNRLASIGIDLGSLNPFLWHRRRKWRLKVQGNPVYQLKDPMEATALLMSAVAKAQGDISASQRDAVLSRFESEFKLSPRDAAALLTSSTHILGDGAEVKANLAKVLAPSLDAFTPGQARSALDLIRQVAEVDGAPTEVQREMLASLESLLVPKAPSQGTWD